MGGTCCGALPGFLINMQEGAKLGQHGIFGGRKSWKPPVSVHLAALEAALLECASSTSMLVVLHSFCSREDCVILFVLFGVFLQ